MKNMGYCFSVNKKKQYFEENQKLFAQSTIQILKVDERVGVTDSMLQENSNAADLNGQLEQIDEEPYEETMKNMETLNESQFGNKLGERILANPKLVCYY